MAPVIPEALLAPVIPECLVDLLALVIPEDLEDLEALEALLAPENLAAPLAQAFLFHFQISELPRGRSLRVQGNSALRIHEGSDQCSPALGGSCFHLHLLLSDRLLSMLYDRRKPGAGSWSHMLFPSTG